MERPLARLGRLVLDGARAAAGGPARRARSRGGRDRTSAPAGRAQERPRGVYPGDFTGNARVEYAPEADGRADPGEVVWGWVPYEEDHSLGKDRPALVVGRDGGWVLALMLTSRDHDDDAAEQALHRRDWMDIGSGAWDSRGRPSEVRLDRVLRLDPDAVRREGARLDRAVFDQVARALRARHGWD